MEKPVAKSECEGIPAKLTFLEHGQLRRCLVAASLCDVSHPKNPLFKGSDWRRHCVRGGLYVALCCIPLWCRGEAVDFFLWF